MSDNDITQAVLSVSVQLFCEDKHEKTVNTPRRITVVYARFSLSVCIPTFYSSKAPRVTYITCLDLLDI